MEYVWLTRGQLNAIADSDTQLSNYFVKALVCDELPETPERSNPELTWSIQILQTNLVNIGLACGLKTIPANS